MGKSTTFDGFTFVNGTYTSHKAKNLLRSAMETLAERPDLKRLGINPEPAKGAIMAKGPDSVWNVFTFTANPGPFNEVPHLTLGIGRDGVSAMATLPNGAPKTLSKPLFGDDLGGFRGEEGLDWEPGTFTVKGAPAAYTNPPQGMEPGLEATRVVVTSGSRSDRGARGAEVDGQQHTASAQP